MKTRFEVLEIVTVNGKVEWRHHYEWNFFETREQAEQKLAELGEGFVIQEVYGD